MNYNTMTNEQLRDLLAQEGKVLTPKQRERLADVQAQEAAAIAAQYDTQRPTDKRGDDSNWFDRALARVPDVVSFIMDVGLTLTTIAQTFIPASLPFLLVALIYAEAERVRYGVMLFETHTYLAYIVAYILVFGNAFVELAIRRQYHAADYIKDVGNMWSLRLWARNMRYRLGFGDDWKPRAKSPAVRLERAQAVLTAAILFLAVGGSMTAAIESAPGNWRVGLLSIWQDSTLLEGVTWAGGLISAIVIVWLAQLVVAYSYEQANDYHGELLERKDALESNVNPDYAAWVSDKQRAQQEARERVERDLLLKELAKRDALPTPQASPNGGNPTPHHNGNGATG